MEKNNCSILINSCDGYEDIWKPFFCCFKDNWKNCPYPIFLNTEHKKYQHDGLNITSLNVIKEKKIEWGERLLDCLSRIETEYVLMLFDDFCLEKEVKQEEIEKCLIELDNNKNIDVFYIIHGFPELVDGTNTKFVEVPIGKEYRLNSAPGIWRKSSLMKYTGKIDNAWAWEFFGTFRTEKNKKSVFYALNKCSDFYPYDYSNGGAIHRGKWVKKVIEPINEKYNLNINLTDRGVEDSTEAHSFLWNIKFTILGFKMIGPKALIFLKGYNFSWFIKKIKNFFYKQ